MFAGIAGALKDDVTIGDVVADTEVAWTERGKCHKATARPGSGLSACRRCSASWHARSQLARKITREGSWTGRLVWPRPGAKAVVAQIACGEKVIANAEYRAWLRAAFSDAVAIENERFALARAGEVHADGQRCVIRGISDNADGTKSDDGHAEAADAAAAFAFELLDAYSTQARGRHATSFTSRDPSPAEAVPQPSAAPARHAFLCYDATTRQLVTAVLQILEPGQGTDHSRADRHDTVNGQLGPANLPTSDPQVADPASSKPPRGRNPTVAAQSHDAGQAAPTIMRDGLLLVGLDVQPGVYRTSGPARPGRDGYIALLASTNTHDILDNVIVTGPATVTIGPQLPPEQTARVCHPHREHERQLE